MEHLIVGIHLIVGLGAGLLWLRQEVSEGVFVPAGSVTNDVYRALERTRDRLFRGSHDVRFTVFRPVHKGTEEFLAPVARLGWGRPTANSTVRFRKDEGLAGKAWIAEPETLLFADLRAGSLEEAREEQKELFSLRPEVAAALSDRQLRAAALAAIPLFAGKRVVGVLTIDSLDGSLLLARLDDIEFLTSLYHLGVQLAALLEPSEHLRISKNTPIRTSTRLASDSNQASKLSAVELVAS